MKFNTEDVVGILRGFRHPFIGEYINQIHKREVKGWISSHDLKEIIGEFLLEEIKKEVVNNK